MLDTFQFGHESKTKTKISPASQIIMDMHRIVEGAVASWLVRSTPDRVLRVQFETWLGTLRYVHGQDI